MIRERPGEPNDRETYIGTVDQEVDFKKYRENYDKINWEESFTEEELRLKPEDCKESKEGFEEFSKILNEALKDLKLDK